MTHLKSRERSIPNGFTFIFPQLPKARPPRALSFAKLCDWVQGIIRNNSFLAQQHRWPQDRESVENWVEDYNARVCLAMGWIDYVTEGRVSASATPFPVPPPAQRRSGGGGAVAAHVSNAAAGMAVIADWLGEGLRPVDKPIAEARAAICAVREGGKVCPMNSEAGGFFQKLDAQAAEEVKKLIEVKNELELTTAQEASLFTCQACDCLLRLKVWTPIDHILKHTSAAVKAKLDPLCWILSEQSKINPS